MSQNKSTKINLSSSVYLNPQGTWAILILQLSTKSHMQNWREQWPWEASQDAADLHGCTCNAAPTEERSNYSDGDSHKTHTSC